MAKGELTVYDVDDTLFKTESAVLVIKNGQLYKRLNAKEFLNYIPDSDESYDFSEHADARLFYNTARPIYSMVNMVKQTLRAKTPEDNVMFLTGRPLPDDKDLFKSAFAKFGIPPEKCIFEFTGLQGYHSTPEAKQARLLEYIHYFNKIKMYDDSKKNLQAINYLKNTHPHVDIQTFLVDSSGNYSSFPY